MYSAEKEGLTAKLDLTRIEQSVRVELDRLHLAWVKSNDKVISFAEWYREYFVKTHPAIKK